MKHLVLLVGQNASRASAEQAVGIFTAQGVAPQLIAYGHIGEPGDPSLEHFHRITDLSQLAQFETIILAGPDSRRWASENEEAISLHLPNSSQTRIYTVDANGRLMRCKEFLTADEYPYIETHAFNRLSRKVKEGYYYFPYGYLYRSFGVGHLDEFGYRISKNIKALSVRPQNKKVIAVFGGSAAFGLFLPDHETFPALLEKLLNTDTQINRRTNYTVLNFAQPGSVALNAIVSFSVLCHRLKPEIVIFHGGYNDLYFGQMSDRFLLTESDITYQNNLEEWSQILHQSQDEPVTWNNSWPEVLAPPTNYPRTIVSSFLNRIAQFRDMVTSDSKSIFINGIQPMLLSKHELSPDEEKIKSEQLGPTAWYAKLHSRMPFLYEKLMSEARFRKMSDAVNFDTVFAKLDGGATHFADMVHTTRQAETVIANEYYKYILQLS